ncbi:MAG: caspase family protein [Bacteroidetes bacterium]|nr:caspase family protein [Bacteroidota bacterium]
MKCKQIIRNKKIFLPIILLCSICINANSQRFYYFKFAPPELKKPSSIQALMVQYDDTDAIVRLGYFDPEQKKNIITECQIQRINRISIGDSNRIEYQLIRAKSIQGESKIPFEQYSIIFKENSEDDGLTPESYGSIRKDGERKFTAALTSSKVLSESDLTEKQLEGLFLKEEPFYKNYTKAKSRSGPNWGTTIPTLHVFILADLYDQHIGRGCNIDQKKLIQFYTSVASKLKIRLDTVNIINEKYNRPGLQKALDSLRPGKEDIVVFHYTGHGFNRDDPNDPYPNLFLMPYADRPVFENLKAVEHEEALRNNTMSIQEIYQIIISKGARLNCVFSDCCNTEYKLKTSTINDGAAKKRGIFTLYPDYCKKLFMDERASFLATAVKKGEEAASTTSVGSIYTDSYLTILGKYLTPAYNGSLDDVNWNAILSNTNTVTKVKAPTIKNTSTQLPFSMSPFFLIQKN